MRYATLGMAAEPSARGPAELVLTLRAGRAATDGVLRPLAVLAASPQVEGAVVAPGASFDLGDGWSVERLDAIEKMELRIKPGGVLSAVVTERKPAILWRHARGLDLLDAEGHRVASITSRDMRTDLPMIAGEGAGAHAAEALALIDLAGPILPRLRGLERMGERRWDVVLDRGQRIMLPTDRPLPALQAAMAMDREDGLLARDVVAVDLRDLSRPVLRMGLAAQNTLRRAAGLPELDAEGNLIDPEEGAGDGDKTGQATRG